MSSPSSNFIYFPFNHVRSYFSWKHSQTHSSILAVKYISLYLNQHQLEQRKAFIEKNLSKTVFFFLQVIDAL